MWTLGSEASQPSTRLGTLVRWPIRCAITWSMPSDAVTGAIPTADSTFELSLTPREQPVFVDAGAHDYHLQMGSSPMTMPQTAMLPRDC